MSGLEVWVYAHALRRAFGDNLLVRGRIRVVDFRKKSLEHEVFSLLASRILLAEMAAHASDTADLAHHRALVGVIAEDMYRRGRGDELDELLRTCGHALAAADAEALVDLGESVMD